MHHSFQKNKQYLAVAFFFILLSCHHAQAKNTDSIDDLTELSLDELMDVTIVSASKKEQKLSHVAASAFVISDEDIKRYGYRTLGEALKKISGLYVSSDRNYDYLGVRGFSLPGDYNSKILVLIDGHRANNPLYDQAYMDESFPVDIESIKRIEVVKGPGSALWGNNALFAVVNIITKKGSDIDGGRIMLEAASHDRLKGYLEYGKVFSSGLNISGSISALDSNGENQIYFPELDQPNFNNGLAEGVDGEDAYKGYLAMAYKEFGLLFNKSKRRKNMPPAAWDGAFNNPGGYTVDETTSIELNHQKHFNSFNGQLFTRIYHDTLNYYGDYPYHEDGGWLGTIIVNKDEGSSKQWGGELRYSMDILPELAITTGFEYMHIYELHQESYDAQPNYSLALNTGNDANTYHTSAYYGQGEYDLLDNLQLIAGLRLDDYSIFAKQLSPRAALLYSPRLSTTLKFLYGEAFRAPNDYERNYDDGLYMTGNNDLHPEEIKTWELVYEQNFGNHTRLVASIFRFEIDRLISQVTIPGDLLQFQNVTGTVRSDGVEIQLESHLENGINGFLGLSTADTRDLNLDTRLNNSPTFIVTGGVSLPLCSEKLYVSTDFQHISDRTSSTEDVDSFTMINVAITSGKVFNNIDLAFNIYNLFDKTVNVPGAGEHYHYDNNAADYIMFNIPQDGRTFRLQLSYSF